METIRLLAPGDEAALESFLRPHAESSMFLLSNLRSSGLAGEGGRYQGPYAAAFHGDLIVGVAAHYGLGMLCVQAPRALAEVVRAAAAASGRPVTGLAGPWEQALAAREALGLANAETAILHRDELFTLALSELRVPEALSSGEVRCRSLLEKDVPLASEWRVAYHLETLGAAPSDGLVTQCREEVERLLAAGEAWVLVREDRVVSFTAFNARLPGVVQVGGVYTPPGLRGRGYGRAAVAGSLLDARAGGVARSVLFTDRGNPGACRAYEALGYRAVSEFGLILFR